MKKINFLKQLNLKSPPSVTKLHLRMFSKNFKRKSLLVVEKTGLMCKKK